MKFLERIMRFANERPVRAATIAGWFQQGCSSGAAILLIPVIVTKLPDAESGLWFSFQGMVALTGLCDFGLGLVVSRQTAHTLKRNEGISSEENDFIDFGCGGAGVQNMRKHVERIYNWTTLAALLLGVIIFELILPNTSALAGVNTQSRPVWYLMLATGLLLVASNRWSSILIGANQVFAARALFGLFFLIQAGLVACCAIFFGELLPMSFASGISALAYLIATKSVAKRCIPELNCGNQSCITGRLDPMLIKRLWQISVPVGVNNLSSFLVNSIQVPMLGALFGPSSVAPFYLAQRILQFASMFVLQPVQAQTTQFTSCLASGKYSQARSIFYSSMGYLIPANLIALTAYVLLSPYAAKILAPGTIYPQTLILILMSLNTFILSTSITGGLFVLASGRNPFMLVSILNGLGNLAALAWLVPKTGLIGIPLAALVSGALSSYFWGYYQTFMLTQSLRSKREL